MSPLVSVFMPVYDGEAWMGEAIRSVLAQTHSRLELLVADDGSTDGSLAIAREMARADPRVRVLPLPHGGEVAARNAAVEAAQGDLLLDHDADDVSLPGKLEALVRHLADHPWISVVGCLGEYFDDTGRTLGRPHLETEPGRIRATFGRANAMINSAALIRRRVFETIGGYREAYRSADDYDFFSRALQAGFELANLPVMLHRIRLHGSSVSASRTMRVADQAYRVQQEYLRSGASSGWRTPPASTSRGIA
ncbi:MAG: glycosyltransferase [Deltaproteobacteria bacterium]